MGSTYAGTVTVMREDGTLLGTTGAALRSWKPGPWGSWGGELAYPFDGPDGEPYLRWTDPPPLLVRFESGHVARAHVVGLPGKQGGGPTVLIRGEGAPPFGDTPA